MEALKGAVTSSAARPWLSRRGSSRSTSAQQVAELAYTVENLGAAAYLGQAGNIQSPEVLATALAIHSVEARHAATLATLVKKPITPNGAFADAGGNVNGPRGGQAVPGVSAGRAKGARR